MPGGETVAKLTAKQAAFVREYLIDLNATQAAIRAGYSPKTARSIGNQLLTKLDIQEAIQAAMKERAKRTEITQDRVLLELSRIAFSDPRALFNCDGTLKPIHKLDDEAAAALAGLEVLEAPEGAASLKKIKRWDKLKALDLLCEHLGIKKGLLNTRDRDPIDDIFNALDDVEADNNE